MGRIICTYNVTEATESIKILNATGGVDNIYYNGNPIGVVQYYTFPTTGLHRLEFEESGIAQVGFANLDALVEVEIIGNEGSLYTSVQEQLFYGCANLNKVTLPNNLKYIYTASFYNCKSLKTITIPSSTEAIYTSAFFGSGLEELIIEGCPNIELSAFAETNKLKTITCYSTTPPVITNTTFKLIAPNGTLNYPEGADYSSWLSTDGWYLGYYGWNTDNSSLLKCYYVWDDNGEVELFNETLTDSVNLIRVGTDTLTQEDGDLSNWYASWDWYDEESGYLIAYIRLNDMTTIPDYFFRYNAKLAKIEIPESITSLGKDVFYDTEKLNAIVCYSTTPPVINETSYGNTFSFINRNGTLYYPEGADYSKWLSTEQGYLGYYGWNGVEIEVDEPDTNYSPEIEIEETTVEVSASASSSYVDVTYIDMESYNPPEIMWGSNWFTLTTTTINNTETVRYFYTIAENNGVERSARVKFSGTGLDGENYEIYLDIIQDKKQQQTMASVTIDGIDFNLENGTLYFDSTGGTKTLRARVQGYTTPYSFKVNVNDDNYSVHLMKSELYYDDGDGYLEWIFDFESDENSTGQSLRGTIDIEYTDGTGSYVSTIPFYVYKTGEGWIKFNQATDFEYDMNGNNINSIKRTYVAVRYFNIDEINEPIIGSTWIHLDSPTLDTATVDGSVIYKYPVTVSANVGEKRTGSVIFSGSDKNGKTVSVTQLFKQEAYAVVPDEPEPDYPEGSDEETYSPIWKDVYYDFTYNSSYSIYTEVRRYINNQIGTVVEEQLLYSGKVYLPPDSESVKVMINKICQNYFENSYLPTDGSVGLIHNYKKFILKGEYGQVLHTYYFVNDWSYKELEVGVKSNPIVPYIGDGQMLFFSAFADSRKQTIKWGMRYYNGENDYVNTTNLTNGFETVIVAPSRQKGVNQFYFGNKVYSMIPKCRCQYVLYYTNPYGGFDWFPILGKVNKKDRITQYTYTNNYNNTTTDFGKYRYLAEITTHYTLNTGFLTEGQSLRMWELLESNCVYLHCLEEDKIYPVIITSTEVDYKKKERGRKMLSYTIDVDYSQTKERI